MPVIVELTRRDCHIARQLATNRYASFEDRTYLGDDWGGSPIKRSYLGVLGEFAVATHYDLTVDSETYDHSDGGSDFRARLDGEYTSIDVKTTAVDDPEWLSVKTNRTDADYYILCRADSIHPTALDSSLPVTILGATTYETLVKGGTVDSKFGHKNYFVYRESMEEPPSRARLVALSDKQRRRRR